MAPCPAAVRTRATCALLLLLLLLWADVRPPPVAGQAPPEADAYAADAAAIEADSDGRGNGTRGGGTAPTPRNKVLSTVDCQICEATCRVKCLINNLFQWGNCYTRCKADNCNDWCR